jgi:hypothetical protein
LYNPNDVVAEWQRLMGRWELAYADYTTLCAKWPMSDGDNGALVGDIRRAQVNLVGIKREIDALLARSAARAQATSPATLQLTVIESKMTDLVEAQSGTKISAGEPEIQPTASVRRYHRLKTAPPGFA